jgi:hypothetical protein
MLMKIVTGAIATTLTLVAMMALGLISPGPRTPDYPGERCELVIAPATDPTGPTPASAGATDYRSDNTWRDEHGRIVAWASTEDSAGFSGPDCLEN